MNLKINKYIFGIIIILSVIGLLSVRLAQKYLPFLLHNTVYYCQEMIRSFSYRLIPQNINLLAFAILVGFLALFVIRVMITLYQILKEGWRLNKSTVSLSNPTLNKLSKVLNIVDKIVVVSEKTPTAVCFGIFNPKIYISDSLIELLSYKELETVLRHEIYHLNQKDNLVMLFAQFLQDVLPFLPIIKDLTRNFRIEREIAADIHAITFTSKLTLIKTLKKLLMYDQKFSYSFIPSITSVETMQARIYAHTKNIKHTNSYKIRNILASVIAIITLSFFAVTPVQAIEFHENGTDAVMACVGTNECERWCKANIVEHADMTKSGTQSIMYSSETTSHY